MLTCQQLASRIEQLQPDALPRDVARLCLLLSNAVENFDELDADGRLREVWMQTGLRLQALTDQHAAMTEELEAMARACPTELNDDDVLRLFRAIKVQSRVLDLYVGQPAPA